MHQEEWAINSGTAEDDEVLRPHVSDLWWDGVADLYDS